MAKKILKGYTGDGLLKNFEDLDFADLPETFREWAIYQHEKTKTIEEFLDEALNYQEIKNIGRWDVPVFTENHFLTSGYYSIPVYFSNEILSGDAFTSSASKGTIYTARTCGEHVITAKVQINLALQIDAQKIYRCGLDLFKREKGSDIFNFEAHLGFDTNKAIVTDTGPKNYYYYNLGGAVPVDLKCGDSVCLKLWTDDLSPTAGVTVISAGHFGAFYYSKKGSRTANSISNPWNL